MFNKGFVHKATNVLAVLFCFEFLISCSLFDFGQDRVSVDDLEVQSVSIPDSYKEEAGEEAGEFGELEEGSGEFDEFGEAEPVGEQEDVEGGGEELGDLEDLDQGEEEVGEFSDSDGEETQLDLEVAQSVEELNQEEGEPDSSQVGLDGSGGVSGSNSLEESGEQELSVQNDGDSVPVQGDERIDLPVESSEEKGSDLVSDNQGPVNTVTGLEYKAYEGGGTVVIETQFPVKYKIREEASTNQWIIEVQGVVLPEKFKRPYITKDFKQNIATINAYQEQKGGLAVFVIQLKGSIPAQVQQEGNTLLIMASEEDLSGSEAQAGLDSDVEDSTSADSYQEKGQPPSDVLPESSYALGNSKYQGELMSIEVSQVDIRDVIGNISEQSGVNVILDSDVSGKVNLRLRDVPWDQILMVLLKTNGLGYVREGNVLRVAKQATLSKEAQELSKQIENEKKARFLAEGVKVKYIPISYAKVESLQEKLKPFMSTEGKMTHDVRTSSLVVTDYEEYLKRITELVKALDIPPMQVEIESKLVEATEDFLRELGINWASQEGDTATFASNTFFKSNNGLSLDLSVGRLKPFGDLTATLGMFERKNKVKVLSQPRIQTLNKVKGSIKNVNQFPVAQVNQLGGIGAQTTYTFRDLVLSLDVTPQITFSGDVIMEVALKREFPGEQVDDGTRAFNSRSAETTVMVKSGETAVIGGIYQLDDSLRDQGVPWLKSIPIIGRLFSGSSKKRNKSELLLFLTPRIIKPRNGVFSSNTNSNMNGGGQETLDFSEMEEGLENIEESPQDEPLETTPDNENLEEAQKVQEV